MVDIGHHPPSGYFWLTWKCTQTPIRLIRAVQNPQLYQNVPKFRIIMPGIVIISMDTVITPSLSYGLRHAFTRRPGSGKRVESLLCRSIPHLLSIPPTTSVPLQTPRLTQIAALQNPQKVHVSTETVIQPVYATFGTSQSSSVSLLSSRIPEIEQTVGSEALLWAYIIPARLLQEKQMGHRHHLPKLS